MSTGVGAGAERLEKIGAHCGAGRDVVIDWRCTLMAAMPQPARTLLTKLEKQKVSSAIAYIHRDRPLK